VCRRKLFPRLCQHHAACPRGQQPAAEILLQRLIAWLTADCVRNKSSRPAWKLPGVRARKACNCRLSSVGFMNEDDSSSDENFAESNQATHGPWHRRATRDHNIR